MENRIDDLSFDNEEFVDQIYANYLANKKSVDPSWRRYFDTLEQPALVSSIQAEASADLRVFNLIEAYRTFGHLMAKINPIATHENPEPHQLKLETLGFKTEELDHSFPTCGLMKQARATLKEMIDTLKAIYCDRIGVEYMGMQSPELEQWLQQRIEPTRFKHELTIDQKRMILQHLNKSELFETFIHTKYVGQKRFSLEGSETLIPMLEALIESGAESGLEEFVLGMAHRGRLNVLSNILNKSYADIFSEFEEGYIPESFEGSGDVKYHKGFYSETETIGGHKVKIVLNPNPSHLEAVNAVVEGQTLAKQIQRQDEKKEKVLPILVHGDAAVAGQGVVYETLQLFGLPGYSTGGTIHIVINNQIGFTTLPRDARSTNYCTDIARAFGAPVFHVDAEDPEGCTYATILALQIRQKFHCDVFLDLNSYRKYGHNETDEPAFTQPLEYQIIRQKKPIREIYRDELIHQGVVEKKLAEALEEEFKKGLQEALKLAKSTDKVKPTIQKLANSNEEDPFKKVETGVSKEVLVDLAKRFCTVPSGFNIHPKLQNLLKERLSMVGNKPVDWGMGEMMAYASLLWQGIPVRISGQDCGRGTFSHRHGLWMDQTVERAYFSLQHLKPDQGRFDLINSPLSEYAVLGFEFGYSIASPETLVIWEAQFGDFSNGAQVIIDQFIASGEQKWGQRSGLTLLLPHGYEGQGPEHSSARLERFLQLSGNDNWQIVYPTLPAQLFHLLRRQMLRPWRKPLIIFSPKGLLRHPDCVNSIEDFTKGTFQEILDDPKKMEKVNTLIFCSGRVYYDLMAERAKAIRDDLAIVRIEQLYPLDQEKIKELIRKYSDVTDYLWVQEEPANMGGWDFIRPLLSELLPNNRPLRFRGRARSASPAVGSHALHKKEYEMLMKKIFS
jgi:2-oxoglutarate dehydrogenase E1 component